MTTRNADVSQAKDSLHPERFPNESAEYRRARDQLLRAEIDLRRQVESVAAMRRELPIGGLVPEDYVFDRGGDSIEDTDTPRHVRLSELFARDGASLAVYSFMYGPKMPEPCPMCTSTLDSLDRTAPHAKQRINLAVVAKSPIARIRSFARGRGWRNLLLLSSAANTYNRDYHGATASDAQMPMLNVFVRRDGEIRHTFGSELLFVKPDPGQDGRHVDLIWPLWNLFDFTPEGRGTDWRPSLDYDRAKT